MSDLPVCKLCDNYPVNYHTGAFGVKHHCDNKHCTLNNVLFTSDQWRTLMGEAAPESVSADHIPDAGKMVVSAEPVAWPQDKKEFSSLLYEELNIFGFSVECILDADWNAMIDKLYASQPAQEWVKCSERMPDIGVPVLGFGHTNEPTTVYRTALRWYEYADDEWIKGVTHWMPLPQPPQE